MNVPRLSVIGSSNVNGTAATIKGPSEKAVRLSVLKILEENILCSMATVARERRAHINTAYFCYSDDLELYFLSHPNALHCRNLVTNPSMAMTIFSSSQQWSGPDKGLQLCGTCNRTSAKQARKAERLYEKRFAPYAKWKQTLKTGDPARSYHFYRFVIRSLKVLHEKKFSEAMFVYATLK
jgi:uncharacterized protein YhbP (UPF0306 family)